MMTTSMYLIGVAGYIVNPAHIAFIRVDGEAVTLAFAAGGPGGPVTITLSGPDGQRFIQLLQSHSPIHK